MAVVRRYRVLSESLNWQLRCLKSMLLVSLIALMSACGGDSSSPDDEVPPADDPSALTEYTEEPLADDLEEANHGAFEGGTKGNGEDAAAANVLQAADQREDGLYNVPTNGLPSPLYGAEAFTQQMMRFEEFGTDALDLGKKDAPTDWVPLPAPATSQAIPEGDELEGFLSQEIWPVPT